jgi:DNA end-binding protein Ku
MLKPDHNVILLIVMRFPETVLKTTELNLPKSQEVPKSQKELALELIDKMKGSFKPEQFKDNYAERLEHIISVKKHGKTVHIEKEEPQMTRTADIMDELKRSLHTLH